MNSVLDATTSPEVKSLKQEIHAIETRLQRFRTRQDSWNEWYLRLGLTTIVVATLLGGLSLFCQRKASNIELSARPFVEELSATNALLRLVLDQAAQLEVAKAQKDAFDASGRAGRAERGAQTAKAKVEGLRLDVANANARAEMDRLARVKIEERLAWRTIGTEDRKVAVGILAPFSGSRVFVSVIGTDPELEAFTNEVARIFYDAHWLISFNKTFMQVPTPYGITCAVDVRTTAGRALETACLALPNVVLKHVVASDFIGVITIGIRAPA